jgi:hypothetical protein
MKYQWVEQGKSCEELSKELGIKINSITKGHIIIGYKDATDAGGNPIQEPITRVGIEIEFDNIDNAKLENLDRKFSVLGLKRKGGKDIASDIEEIKNRVKALENAVKSKNSHLTT